MSQHAPDHIDARGSAIPDCRYSGDGAVVESGSHQQVMTPRTLAIIVLAAQLFSGCGNDDGATGHVSSAPPMDETPPAYVYLRGADVSVEVRIVAPTDAVVGQWYTLSASRRTSGTWPRAPWSDDLIDKDWLGVSPPPYEEEVAANLDWHTEPVGVAEFDCCSIVDGDPWRRQIKFKQPGAFKLWAESAHPIQGTSNVIRVLVSE